MAESGAEPVRVISNLKLRILSASALAPVVLAAVYFGGYWLAALLALLVLLATLEWQQIARGENGFQLDIMAGCAAAAYICTIFGEYSIAWFVILSASAALLISSRLGSTHALWQGFGLAYLMPLPVTLLWLREAPHLVDGAMLIFWLLIVVWSTDTGAYFGGRAIGGPRLAPRISPGKTWSGAIVGAIVGATAGTGFAFLAIDAGGAAIWMICGLTLAAWSQLGDLFESAIKRSRNIKDSGSIIPGHGGILDRVDSLAFAAPGVAVILWIVE